MRHPTFAFQEFLVDCYKSSACGVHEVQLKTKPLLV